MEMAKEVLATTPKVTSTQRVIKEPPAPQQVRIYHKSDGTHQDVFPVDAKEAVASGEYTMDAPIVSTESENVHKPIRPETVTGLMPEMAVPLAELEHKADDDDDLNMTLRGPLPDDFPSRSALDAAGYGTYAKVRKLIAKGEGWYKDVPDIGEKRFGAIEDALKEK
jgi:hypothetical protein